VSCPFVQASLFPPELTALRAGGLVLAVLIAGYAVWRRRSLRNVDVLMLLAIAVGLALVAGTQALDALLSAFSFQKGNGTRIIGVAVLAILVLFGLVLRSLAQGSRITSELSALLEGLAWEQFRAAGQPQRFAGKLGVLIPAYNEAESIASVLERIPAEVCGLETAVLVVDDGSRDATGEVASHGLPAALRLGSCDRRHPGCRRPAPSRRDVPPGRARRRRRGRRRPRLARPGRG